MPITDEQAQARALAEVQAYCGWHIAPNEEVTFTLDGSGATVQPLPTLRLTELTSVIDADSTVDVTTVEWSEAGFLRRDAAWTSRLRGVVVDVTHGYATMPLDVQAVIDRLAARHLEADSMSSTLVQVGQVRAAVGDDGLPAYGSLTSLDRLVLDRYRLPSRP